MIERVYTVRMNDGFCLKEFKEGQFKLALNYFKKSKESSYLELEDLEDGCCYYSKKLRVKKDNPPIED